MKNIFGIVLMLGGIGFSQMACGLSPLLHHADAATQNDVNKNNSPDLMSGTNGCDFYFKTQNLCATLTWVQKQSNDEMGEFTLAFWNKDQATQTGPFQKPDADQVFVKLLMPAMGHGSSPIKVSALTDGSGQTLTGKYDASNVYFSMPGLWQIIVQLKTNKQVIDSAMIEYTEN